MRGLLARKLVAVGGSRPLDRVDDAGEQREVVRGRRQLDEPLRVVALLQGIEGRLIDPVRAHELPDVGHDLALFLGQLAGVTLRPQEIDGLLADPVAPGRAHLRRPHVGGLALPHRRQDGDRAQLRVGHALVAEERHEPEHALGELWAVEQHAEGSSHASEDLHDGVDDGVLLGGDVGFTADRCESWHGWGPFVRKDGTDSLTLLAGLSTIPPRKELPMARRIFVLVWLCMLGVAPASAQEPVRLGVLTIRSGPIASCGRQMEEGLQFALKERGNTLGGRKVEGFFGDSAGQPAQTRAKTLELVERNRVHVLTGPVAAFEAYAISDYIARPRSRSSSPRPPPTTSPSARPTRGSCARR